VIFSLGSSSVISNVIAGYTMTYRRAFRVGDRIQVGDVTGFVTEASLLVTRVRSVKNEEIVIPNSQILNGAVTTTARLPALMACRTCSIIASITSFRWSGS
jgi:small-conductance mechanosensitive channel